MPIPNIEIVRQRLEAARKTLLDLTARNKLLNYKTPRSSGVEVVNEDPAEVLRILVVENRPMTFLGKPDKKDGNEREDSLFEDVEKHDSEDEEDLLPIDFLDLYLNTEETTYALQRRLLKTLRDAQSSLEEQGVNVLFLALGLLDWYESESSQELRKAPLILIPVLIEGRRGSKFRIRYEGTEIGSNLSLIAKLDQDFGIEFPELPEAESVDVRAYFSLVKEATVDQKRWTVDDQAIVLGFFGYAKYLMFKDLGGGLWPEDEKPWLNDIICSLLDCGFEDVGLGISEEENLDTHRPIAEITEVCDVDSSQALAILEAKSGRSMVIEGPPGTGKSQTITNLMADAINQGKKVLFVAEKRAALEVVWRNLEKVGLHDACLELHSNKTNKKAFYEKLKETMDLGKPRIAELKAELHNLSNLRDALNGYSEALHQPLPGRAVTPFAAIGHTLKLGEERVTLEKPSFSIMQGWTQTDFLAKLELVKRIQEKIREIDVPAHNPFFGIGLRLLLPPDRNALTKQIEITQQSLSEFVLDSKDLAEKLRIPPPTDRNDVADLCRTAAMKIEALSLRRDMIHFRTKYSEEFAQQLWTVHLQQDKENVSKYGQKWWRILSPKYRSSLRKIRSFLKQSEARVVERFQKWESHCTELLSMLEAQKDLAALPSMSFADQSSILATWLDDMAKINEIIAYNLLCDEAHDKEIESVSEVAAHWELAGSHLAEAFERSWYSGILREAFQARPELARFERTNHEAMINSFRELDRIILQYNQAKAALKHWEEIPHYSASGALGLIQSLSERKRGHLPIRKIMSEAGEAIQAIKPVFMMSPLSVAMYLPPEGPRFDLVIFDEASQIKPADALGAIIRSDQAVVVGDSQQLPPTSFFDKLTQIDDAEEEEDLDLNIARDMESILALMRAKIPPVSSQRRDLRWHYRSKHDSLIAPSNRLFYRDRLIVFPCADRKRERLGLVFHHLPNTIYGRGASRKNLDEARIVAQAVLKHVKENPNLTLGVAAFNIAQQEAIQDELELIRLREPILAEFDKIHPYEPLFVKNLETVQGDERDVIFISVGFGRDTNGWVSMNFGPLNKDGGERRLNVLITRARERCEVFTNLKAQDIRIGETPARGVHALRTFLHFASTGELDLPAPTGKEPQSDFEIAVIEALQAHGYSVVPQVGSSGFFVDIGVCDPHNPERFVLGIECDGKKYHSARSARDRDRLRQEVLERRGWRIHRIWSTDWWQNPERELKRALEAIEQALICKEDPSHPPQLPAITAEIEREPQKEPIQGPNSTEYAFAKPNVVLRGFQLRDTYPQKMAEWVLQVVEVESPIHLEEIVRRIREAAGLGRAGDPIREAVLRGIKFGVKQGKIEYRKKIAWITPISAPKVRNRSALPSAYKKLEFVAVEEIEIALIEVIETSFGISREEAIISALRLLGFERVTQDMFNRVTDLITKLVKSGRITIEGNKLK